jgi:hypothetical protein
MSRHDKERRRRHQARLERDAAAGVAVVDAPPVDFASLPEAWPASPEPQSPPLRLVPQDRSQASQTASGAVNRFYSLKECAVMRGCSVKTIRREIDAGRFLRPVLDAGKLKIVRAEFEAWYQERLNNRAG